MRIGLRPWARPSCSRNLCGSLTAAVKARVCWPTPFLLETAKSHLTGAVKDWLRSRHAEIASREDLEYQFRRTFVSQTRAAERWRRMQDRLIGMIHTGSSGCLLRASAAARCGAELMRDPTPLYGFGNQDVPAVRTIGKCKADLGIDGVTGKNIPIFVVPDEAQSVNLLSQCPFSHLEPWRDDPKLIVKTTERSTLQANVINWITLSSESDVTGPVLFNNCGKEILLDMKDGEIAVPVSPSGNNEVVNRKGQRLGRVTAVDIVKTPGEEDNQRNRTEES
ncbi:hypothetical protein HPB47_004681 [Ixodes persulcatus]|uniref:Uncharacterized protein n=1 Tax=Ixodes persulcatus TaxID=34615 RepID=A0AC60PF89_IXOPE|nr:hypothetical protein HPB47_004681 [Ixodes persulcatus]